MFNMVSKNARSSKNCFGINKDQYMQYNNDTDEGI